MTDDEACQQAKLELFKNSLNHHEMLTEALVSLIQTGLRISFLLNGGAIIAVLSVYGAKGGDGMALPGWSIGMASLCWIVGLISGAVSAGSTTRAQHEFQKLAGNLYKYYAQELFSFKVPSKDKPDLEKGMDDALKCGLSFRKLSMRNWRVSIGVFILGAFISVIGLFWQLSAAGQQ